VRTPLVEAQVAAQARVHGVAESEVLEKIFLETNAIKRLIEPDEVAAAVEFLCRPGAWAMTGNVFPMNSGWLAH